MFNLDDSQWRVIRFAGASAFAFWLLGQIADSSFFERLWNQVTLLTIGAGAVRVLTLEAASFCGPHAAKRTRPPRPAGDGPASTAFALRIGWSGWAVYLGVGNVLVNLYPVLLQRYTRARLSRLALRARGAEAGGG